MPYPDEYNAWLLAELSKKALHVKELPEDWDEQGTIYEAWRKWKCRPMMRSPHDEVYLMHESDVVFVGCRKNVESFVRSWITPA